MEDLVGADKLVLKDVFPIQVALDLCLKIVTWPGLICVGLLWLILSVKVEGLK